MPVIASLHLSPFPHAVCPLGEDNGKMPACKMPASSSPTGPDDLSQISQQDLHATQAHHAEEGVDAVLPAGDQATKVMQPGKEPFHSPTLADMPIFPNLTRPNRQCLVKVADRDVGVSAQIRNRSLQSLQPSQSCCAAPGIGSGRHLLVFETFWFRRCR